MGANSPSEVKAGLLAGLGAYILWGLAPIYFKWIEAASAWEILGHRILWSVFILGTLLKLQGHWHYVTRCLKDRRTALGLLASALVVTLNWLTFIWAINNERILETSLGYFINPLVFILLAAVFLREHLRGIQWLAVAIATIGIIVQVVQLGELPWVSLVLAVSFGVYGLIRKQLGAPSMTGLFIETLYMVPLGVAIIGWHIYHDQLAFAHISIKLDILLAAAGLVTAIPLILFGAAANRVSLTTIGFLQYLAPSMTFLLAIFVYNEPISSAKLFSFGLIWFALAIFSGESYYRHKRTTIDQ
jgi:chloramphenicol-sensitive protein RarD